MLIDIYRKKGPIKSRKKNPKKLRKSCVSFFFSSREKKRNVFKSINTFSYRSFRNYMSIYVLMCTYELGRSQIIPFLLFNKFKSNKTVNSCFSFTSQPHSSNQTEPKQMFTSLYMRIRTLSNRSLSTSHRARTNFGHVIIYNCTDIGCFKSFSKDDDDDDRHESWHLLCTTDQNIYKRIYCAWMCIE